MNTNENHILVSLSNGVRLIKFNRPSKKNAIDTAMYEQLTKILTEDSKDNDVVATIFTGVGDYYSSGNEINIKEVDTVQEACDKVQFFVDALIDYPKLLIAVVNGPSIGIAVTILGLFDVVYASDRATFHTPFVKLGLCAEGCSSYLFPRILGRSKASEMLLLAKKLTATEACDAGLISKIIPHEKLEEFLNGLMKYGTLPLQSLLKSKELINGPLRKTLHEVNRNEMVMVYKCINDNDFINSALAFMSRKSKL